MPSNRRRHINALPGLKLLMGFSVGVVLLLTGLGYVYGQNKLHRMSDEVGRLEREYQRLRTMSEVVEVNISKLSSPGELKTKLHNGFFKLSEIKSENVISLNAANKRPGGEKQELRAVAIGKATP